MKLIYIGHEFYVKSNTSMSSIYDTAGRRQDWGTVQIALCNGEDVHIRPATDEELVPYYKRLMEIMDKKK